MMLTKKLLSAKAQADEIVNPAMEDAKIQSEEITREAVEQEERVQEVTVFTRNMLHEQLSILEEKLYTIRS